MAKNGKKQHGGSRQNAGRPPKQDSSNYQLVTCVLRKDTVERLKAGAGGKGRFFGAFLQYHLDRFPLPSNEEYAALKTGTRLFKLIKRKRIPVISAGRVRVSKRPKVRSPEQAKVRELFQKEFVPVA